MSIQTWELEQKLNEEMNREAKELATGSCMMSSHETEVGSVAMLYRERVGYIMGLTKALEIVKQLELGENG